MAEKEITEVVEREKTKSITICDACGREADHTFVSQPKVQMDRGGARGRFIDAIITTKDFRNKQPKTFAPSGEHSAIIEPDYEKRLDLCQGCVESVETSLI